MTIPSFSPATIRKARALRGAGLIAADPTQPHVWIVTSLRPEGAEYRVQEDVRRGADGSLNCTWLTCTCAHGMNRGAGQPHCYHVAAVLIGYLEDEQKAIGTRRMSGAEFIAAYGPHPETEAADEVYGHAPQEAR